MEEKSRHRRRTRPGPQHDNQHQQSRLELELRRRHAIEQMLQSRRRARREPPIGVSTSSQEPEPAPAPLHEPHPSQSTDTPSPAPPRPRLRHQPRVQSENSSKRPKSKSKQPGPSPGPGTSGNAGAPAPVVSKKTRPAPPPPQPPQPPARPVTGNFRPRTARQKHETDDIGDAVDALIRSATDSQEALPPTINVQDVSPRDRAEIMLDIDTEPEVENSYAPEELVFHHELMPPAPSSSGRVHESPSAATSAASSSMTLQPEAPGPSGLLSPSMAASAPDLDRGDGPSRLSFIMQERLHYIAKNLRRRTIDVMELMNEDIELDSDDDKTTDDINKLPAVVDSDESLMSLIGLMQRHSEMEENRNSRHCFCIPFFIDPFSKKYLLWLLVMVLSFAYNAFTIPLRIAYPYQTEENLHQWCIADYSFDCIYLFDMLVIKPRLIYMHSGITHWKFKETSRHYLVSLRFKLNIIGLLPTDLGYFITGPIAIWRINRLVQIISFWEFFDLLDNTFSSPYIIRITRTTCYMIYLIHCNSCVYYVLSAWQAFGQLPYFHRGHWYLNKWVYNNQGNAYIRCFYFTAAVATSTGNNPPPTNVIEYGYMTFSWMMGVFVFALLLGQIRDIVYNANKNVEEFRSMMDKALGECTRLGLPITVCEKVRTWFLYTYERQKTLDEKRLVERLPLKLQTDLALSVHYATLSKVELFQDADPALLRDLVLRLQPVTFLPGDVICNKGDVGKEMYIINQGVLEVTSPDYQTVYVTMSEGKVFGEISLLGIDGNNRRTASIRSRGFSTLFVLSKEDLNDVLKDYPDAKGIMLKKAKQILNKDSKAKQAKDREAYREALRTKCAIRAKIPTPKMLQTVTQVLPHDWRVAQELKTLLERESLTAKREGRNRRGNTVPSRLEKAAGVKKSHSCDDPTGRSRLDARRRHFHHRRHKSRPSKDKQDAGAAESAPAGDDHQKPTPESTKNGKDENA